MYCRKIYQRYIFQVKALLRIKVASYVLPNRLIASNQNNNFLYITNFTVFINTLLGRVLTIWSAQYWHKYETREWIVDLPVTWISIFFMIEDSKLHMLKWSWNNTRVLKRNTISWYCWRSQSWIAKSSGCSIWKDRDKRKSLNFKRPIVKAKDRTRINDWHKTFSNEP